MKPQVSDALMSQIDWFASFAHMLNVAIPQGAAPDSQNQLKAWLGKDKKGRDFVVEQNLQNNLSITDGTWKFISPGKGPFFNKNAKVEMGNMQEDQLYNLKKDIGEKDNIATKNPKQVERLKKQLDKIKSSQ